MNNYPIVDAVLQFDDDISSDDQSLAILLGAVSGGYRVLRSVEAGYNSTSGVGTLEVADVVNGSPVIFKQPIHGDGQVFDFGDFPLVSSKGANMKVTISAGGFGIKAHLNVTFQ